MNTTAERWGTKLSTRMGSREMQLTVEAARTQTRIMALDAASKESLRRKRPLVYRLRGQNLDGPKREKTKQGSRLCCKVTGALGRGAFVVVDGTRIQTVIVRL